MWDVRLDRRGRRALLLGLVCLVVSINGCGGGGDDTLGPAVASFTPSGTPAAPNLVRITGDAAGDLVTVRIVVGGPTTSDDLYSFVFDLVLSDPTVAVLVDQVVFVGPALTLYLGQTAQALATQNGGRITIGITKLGGGLGNGIPAGEREVARMLFRVVGPGSTLLGIEGSAPPGPVVLDSNGTTIGSITFDAAPAVIGGS